MKNKDLILNYLVKKIENPKVELNYNKDYELLLAVMLSAQTTDVRVNSVTDILFAKFDSIVKLASASVLEIESIIRPIGTYKKKASNVSEIAKILLNGYDLSDRSFLESLPGVGRKTANVVLANLYNFNVIAVDTHVMRVSKRLNLVKEADNVIQIEKKLTKIFGSDLGMLHHRLVLFGRYYCKAVKPICTDCELFDICKEKKRFK